MKVIVRTRIYPTESPEKVILGLKELFPTINFSVSGNEIIGESDSLLSLQKFQEGIRARRIRETIEHILLENWSGGRTWIRLNKQDSLKGVFNVAESSPLGDILLEIEIPRSEIHSLVWGNGD